MLEMETAEEVDSFSFGQELAIFVEQFCQVLVGGIKFFGGSCA